MRQICTHIVINNIFACDFDRYPSRYCISHHLDQISWKIHVVFACYNQLHRTRLISHHIQTLQWHRKPAVIRRPNASVPLIGEQRSKRPEDFETDDCSTDVFGKQRQKHAMASTHRMLRWWTKWWRQDDAGDDGLVKGDGKGYEESRWGCGFLLTLRYVRKESS